MFSHVFCIDTDNSGYKNNNLKTKLEVENQTRTVVRMHKKKNNIE